MTRTACAFYHWQKACKLPLVSAKGVEAVQRRQILKALLPVGLVFAGLASSISVVGSATCSRMSPARLLQRLRPFSDSQLGKAVQQPIGNGLERFSALCEENFDQDYRAMVAQDFSTGKIVRVDHWLLSETEAITHRALILSH